MNKVWRIFPALMAGALAIEYILGMIVNLYVQFPEGVKNWEVARTTPILLTHVVLGTIITLGAIVYLVMVIVKKYRPLLFAAIAGLIFTICAYIGGEGFMETSNDGFSLLMALGFMLAIGTYSAAMRFNNKVTSSAALSLKK